MGQISRRRPLTTLTLWCISILSSVLLLWLAHARFGVELWPDRVRLPNPELLWLAAALYPLYAGVRAARLQFVLDPLVRAATQDPTARFDRRVLYGSGFLSFFVLLLLPFKLGEASRPLLLMGPKIPGVGASAAVGAVGSERILDGLLICAMLFAGIGMNPQTHGDGESWAQVASFGQVMGAAFVFALVVALVAAQEPARWGRGASRMVAPVGTRAAAFVARAVERLASAFAGLLEVRRSIPLVIFSALYWAITVVQLWLVAHSCGLELSASGAMVVVSVVGLSIQLPGGPAQTGTFQIGAGAALALVVDLAVVRTQAQGFVAVMFALQTLGALVMAVPGLALMALSRRGTALAAKPSAPRPQPSGP